MARFDTDGFDELLADINKASLSDDETDEILRAGAEQVKLAWKFSAEFHGLRSTGDMINSIGFVKKPKKASGVKYIDISPQGKDSKGIRNAEKAFYNHYGTSGEKGIKATRWVDMADELCESEFSVKDAMQNKYNEILDRKGI